MSELMKRMLLVLAAGMMSNLVQATDLNISGIVVASPCNVDSGSVSKDVDFGQVRSTDLKEAGTATNWQPFQIKLTSCPLGTKKATVTFSGTRAAEDATLYANAGTATNVAVAMALDANHNQLLGDGSNTTVDIDAQHNAVYSLAGRLYSTNGSTGPGTFRSIVQMNFTYQ